MVIIGTALLVFLSRQLPRGNRNPILLLKANVRRTGTTGIALPVSLSLRLHLQLSSPRLQLPVTMTRNAKLTEIIGIARRVFQSPRLPPETRRRSLLPMASARHTETTGTALLASPSPPPRHHPNLLIRPRKNVKHTVITGIVHPEFRSQRPHRLRKPRNANTTLITGTAHRASPNQARSHQIPVRRLFHRRPISLRRPSRVPLRLL